MLKLGPGFPSPTCRFWSCVPFKEQYHQNRNEFYTWWFNPFPCGIGPFGPGLLCLNTTQRGSILKIWKNYVIHGSCLSLIFIFRCFITKCYFIPVIHGFLGPTPKSWAIWPTAALWTIFNKCGKNSLKKSGCVTLLNDGEPHRHLRAIFIKQKLFLLKSWF